MKTMMVASPETASERDRHTHRKTPTWMMMMITTYYVHMICFYEIYLKKTFENGAFSFHFNFSIDCVSSLIRIS